jgi:GDP-L-fucose synthase
MKLGRIFLAGHKGLVGSAIIRRLNQIKYKNKIYTIDKAQLNLIDQNKTLKYLKKIKPDTVLIAAAKVGGVKANSDYPAEFIFENLQIQNNLIHSSYLSGVKKILFLGSSCIYPKNTKQPINEAMLLSGKLEKTNEAYAIAKIAGIKLCESYNKQYGTDYRSVMPTNLYGLNDNYNIDNGHVLPSLLRRFHEAKIKNIKAIKVWGSGLQKREFLNSNDMAEACLHVLNLSKKNFNNISFDKSFINIGCGSDISIKKLAILVGKTVGFSGKILFDKNQPEGVKRKLLNNSKLNLTGWRPKINLEEGLKIVYKDFLKNF